MNTHLLQFLLSRLELVTKKPKATGFTLVELLVSMLMAGIIISSLLYLMVNLLQTDQKEAATNQAQGEMQAAMDYITSDLRDAVYVYDEVTKLLPYLPEFATTHKPILAFWKAESVEEQGQALPSDCTLATFTDLQKAECTSLRVRQNTYTLVVYLQSKDETNQKWQGKSRIRRYQLRKYTTMSTLALSTGYVDPSQTNTSFQQWPRDITSTTVPKPSLQAARPTVDNGEALVDFVADPDITTVGVPSCPSTDGDNDFDADDDYKRTPAATGYTSFFACVRKEVSSVGLNQDIVVFLRGNPEGKTGILPGTVADKQLPTLQSQVIARGVVDKAPPQ